MMRIRQGFTLFELIIVVFIITMIYTLVFTYFSEEESKPKPLSPLTLKKTLSDSGQLMGRTTLLCIDQCRTCYLKQGAQSEFIAYENSLNLKDTEVYYLDEHQHLSVPEYGRYKDKKVCLKLNFYPNGSSTKVILKTAEGVFYLPSYFGKPQKVESLEDAKDLWLAETQLASSTGDFY